MNRDGGDQAPAHAGNEQTASVYGTTAAATCRCSDSRPRTLVRRMPGSTSRKIGKFGTTPTSWSNTVPATAGRGSMRNGTAPAVVWFGAGPSVCHTPRW
jgi:hypothetical protein